MATWPVRRSVALAVVVAGLTVWAGWSQAEWRLDLSEVVDPDLAVAIGPTTQLSTLAEVAGVKDFADLVSTEQQRLVAMLRAFGYLDATVAREEEAGGRGGTLVLHPGPLYHIGIVEISGLGTDAPAELLADIRAVIATWAGEPARAEALGRLEDEVKWRVRNASYAFSRVVARTAMPIGASHTARVAILIDRGPPARFGVVTVDGPDTRREIAELAAPLVGQPFRMDLFNEFRQQAAEALQPGTARFELAEVPDEAGRVSVDVRFRPPPAAVRALALDGAPGLAATAVALAALGLRQLGRSARGRRRWRPGVVDFTILGMLAVAGWLGALRVIALAGLG